MINLLLLHTRRELICVVEEAKYCSLINYPLEEL